MAGKISRGVTVPGVIAYQDDDDPRQFHYFPSAPKLTLRDNLEAFSVHYWGIGDLYFSRDPDTEQISSRVGAIMSGQVVFDATGEQKRALEAKIREIYEISNPQLVPLYFANVKAVPIFAEKTLGLGADGEFRFPTDVQAGSSVTYNIANGSGKFAQLFANVAAAGGREGLPNPDFAVGVYGDVELVGDPWKVEISADLSQVWEFTRAKFSASAQIGWFNLGSAEVTKLMQDLVKSEKVKIRYVQGSLDQKDPGSQLFEQGKLLFEALNTQLASGEGLFKLEPNPTPPEPPAGGGSVVPWSISVNGAYQSTFFSQSVKWSRELEFVGRTLRRMPSSVVLALTCGPETQQFFFDLGDPDEPCVTTSKIRKMQNRLSAEKAAQDRVVGQAAKDVEENKLDRRTYTGLVNFLQENSITEDVKQSKAASLTDATGRAIGITRFSRRADDYHDLLVDAVRACAR